MRSTHTAPTYTAANFTILRADPVPRKTTAFELYVPLCTLGGALRKNGVYRAEVDWFDGWHVFTAGRFAQPLADPPQLPVHERRVHTISSRTNDALAGHTLRRTSSSRGDTAATTASRAPPHHSAVTRLSRSVQWSGTTRQHFRLAVFAFRLTARCSCGFCLLWVLCRHSRHPVVVPHVHHCQ